MSDNTNRCCVCGKECLPDEPLTQIKLFTRGPRGGIRGEKVWGEGHENCVMARLGGRGLLAVLKATSRDGAKRLRATNKALAAQAAAVGPA